ncbi:hypothetical protein K438DRAFT_296498 [Mycena galopus ATCC 62051]|nr:hypothetical protein K438DRAFT_296498 [Mycena galopus ATCC 62051]
MRPSLRSNVRDGRGRNKYNRRLGPKPNFSSIHRSYSSTHLSSHSSFPPHLDNEARIFFCRPRARPFRRCKSYPPRHGRTRLPDLPSPMLPSFLSSYLRSSTHLTKLTPTLDALVAAAGPEGQLPAARVIPLIQQLTVALNTASAQLAANPPGGVIVTDEVLAQLIQNVLDDLNTALNTLVSKLGLDGLLTPLDAAVVGLLKLAGSRYTSSTGSYIRHKCNTIVT